MMPFNRLVTRDEHLQENERMNSEEVGENINVFKGVQQTEAAESKHRNQKNMKVLGVPRTPLGDLKSKEKKKMSSKAKAMAKAKDPAAIRVTPVYPKFIPVAQTEITSVSNSNGFKFRLVSYNILAQVYARGSRYPHSPSSCLKWKSRRQMIFDVIRTLDADILCLQELDEYEEFYKEKIEQNDYSSIYIKRSGTKLDGCGIFYKHDRLESVIDERIDYNDLADLILDERIDKEGIGPDNAGQGKTSRDRGDPNDPYVRLKRDCVGIIAAFKFKEPYDHYVIVANTHLYWDPEWADVKLKQAKYLLSRVDQFKKVVSEKYECSPSVLIAGDFNSVPGDKVYQYLLSGGSIEEPSQEYSEGLPMRLCSVYGCTRGEPRFTNCTPDFMGTIDYILFSPSEGIEPVSYLELPEAESSDVKGGLPNYYHPSDHLPIGCEFVVL